MADFSEGVLMLRNPGLCLGEPALLNVPLLAFIEVALMDTCRKLRQGSLPLLFLYFSPAGFMVNI